MKRLMICLLTAALLLNCAVAEDRLGADLSYGRVVDMALYMRQLATGDYLQVKQVPDDLRSIASTWAAGITDTPRMVVQLDVNGFSDMLDTQVYFLQEPEMVSYEAQSNTVSLVWQYLAYYASQEAGLTDASYEQIVELNGHINAQMIYAEDGAQGNAMYIVLYEGAAPILLMVSAENGAVCIQGAFLPSSRLSKCQNYGQVAFWLMLNGFSITCSEILPE